MNTTSEHLLRLYLTITAPRERNERGDVPGWVMITVMTIGLAAVIWGLAEPELKALLTNAFSSAGKPSP